MNGKLPTAAQWDKAAGRYDVNRRIGPYRGTWPAKKEKEENRPKIAVGELLAPWKVGDATDDVSSKDCQDMSGNGVEWTNSIDGEERLLSSLKEESDPSINSVIQRGWGYNNPGPLTFKQIESTTGVGSLPFNQNNEELNNVSFRVVLNPNE